VGRVCVETTRTVSLEEQRRHHVECSVRGLNRNCRVSVNVVVVFLRKCGWCGGQLLCYARAVALVGKEKKTNK